MNPQGPQMQIVMPLTPVVKRLIIVNVSVWFLATLILQKFILDQPLINTWFGLVPAKVFSDFWVWQVVSYMFLHSDNVFHILFNMVMLWWLGSDLEARWGGQWFLLFYLIAGVGAGLIYLAGIGIYYSFSQNMGPLMLPVVGASGAIFGLLLSYGILFGERVVYFLMLFPMRARYFVIILGGIEVASLMNSGFSNGVANLAHLGGLVSGFLGLVVLTRLRGYKQRKSVKRHGRNLKLVVDNERQPNDKNGPRFWN